MERHPFGSTGLLVSPIGLGLAALGRPGYINLGHSDDMAGRYEVAEMEARTHRVLDVAWNAGIRYFDAARSYGKAEVFLASWLQARSISPEDVTIGSKWGYTYTANWQVKAEKHEIKEHSLSVLQRQWQESHENLVPHLRLYQIHSATLESGVLENQEVLAELARLKATGLAIGLTVSGPNQAEIVQRSLAVAVDGVRLFDSVQATWNLLEPSVGPALQQAHEAGLGVMIKEALANGRLTPRAATTPAESRTYERMAAQASRLNTTVDALALAAVLAQPWGTMVLSGAATEEHLQSNIQALRVLWDETATAELATLAESPEHYWQTRSNLDWN